MAQDLTIEIGIDTLSAIATLKNLGDIADSVFAKKRKLAFDDNSIKEFSNNLQNEFAKAAQSLDFTPSFDAALNKVSELEAALKSIGLVSADGFSAIGTELQKAQQNAGNLSGSLEEVKGKTQEVAQEMEGADSGGMFTKLTESINGIKGLSIYELIAQSLIKIGDAGLVATEKNRALEISFRNAGLAGESLQTQLEATNALSRDLGFALGEPPQRIRDLAAAAADLGSVTGKANSDLVKLGIGIEKSTNGAVTAEKAMELFIGGFSKPENAQSINTLLQQFPQLHNVLSSTGDIGTKAAAGLAVVTPSLDALALKAGETQGVLTNVFSIVTESFSSLGAGIVDGISTGLSALGSLSGSFDLSAVFAGLDKAGTFIGGILSDSLISIGEIIKSLQPLLDVLVKDYLANMVLMWEHIRIAVESAFDILVRTVQGAMEILTPFINLFNSLFSTVGSGQEIFASISAVLEDFYDVVEELADLLIVSLVEGINYTIAPLINLANYLTALISDMSGGSSVVNIFKTAFASLSTILQETSVILSGVTGGLRGAMQGVREFMTALTSFDLGKIKDAFFKIGTYTQEGYKKGVTDKKTEQISKDLVQSFQKAIQNIDNQLTVDPNVKVKVALNLNNQIETLRSEIEKTFHDTKISDSQRTQLEAQLDNLLIKQQNLNQQIKEGNAEEAKRKTSPVVVKQKTDELAAARKLYEELKQKNQLELEEFENLKLAKALSEGRNLSESENLEIAQKKLEIEKKNLEAFRDSFKVLEKDGKAHGIELNISEQSKTKVLLEYANLKQELLKEEIEIKNVKFSEKVNQDLDSIINSFNNTELEMNLEMSNSAEVNNTINNAQEKINKLNQQISNLELALNATSDKTEQEILNAAISKAKNDVKAVEGGISTLRANVRNAEYDKRLALLDDENEKELLQKKAALNKQMEEDLKSFDLTEEEKAIIRQRNRLKESELDEEFRLKNERSFIRGLEDGAVVAYNTMHEVFSKPFDFSAHFKDQEDVKKQLQDLNSEQDKLFDRLKNNDISFEDYQNELAGVNAQIKELNALKKDIDIWDYFTERAITAFSAVSESMTGMYDSLLEEKDKYGIKVGKLDKKLAEIADTGSAEYQETLRQRNEAETNAANTTNQIFGVMAVQMAANLGKMVAEGKPALQAFVVSLLDTLQAMVPVFVAMITGFSLASAESVLTFGVAGLLKAAAISALLYTALGVARAAVANAFGFKDGGEIGLDAGIKVGGRQFVMVNETGESEFVVNAKSYQKNKALLQHLNNGGTFESYMASRALSGVYVTPEGTLTGGNTLSHKVYEIQQILPRLQNQTTVAINTMFEIQRRSDKELISVMRGMRKDIRSLANSYESHNYGHLDITLDKGVIIKKMESDINLQRVR